MWTDISQCAFYRLVRASRDGGTTHTLRVHKIRNLLEEEGEGDRQKEKCFAVVVALCFYVCVCGSALDARVNVMYVFACGGVHLLLPTGHCRSAPVYYGKPRQVCVCWLSWWLIILLLQGRCGCVCSDVGVDDLDHVMPNRPSVCVRSRDDFRHSIAAFNSCATVSSLELYKDKECQYTYSREDRSCYMCHNSLAQNTQTWIATYMF